MYTRTNEAEAIAYSLGLPLTTVFCLVETLIYWQTWDPSLLEVRLVHFWWYRRSADPHRTRRHQLVPTDISPLHLHFLKFPSNFCFELSIPGLHKHGCPDLPTCRRGQSFDHPVRCSKDCAGFLGNSTNNLQCGNSDSKFPCLLHEILLLSRFENGFMLTDAVKWYTVLVRGIYLVVVSQGTI